MGVSFLLGITVVMFILASKVVNRDKVNRTILFLFSFVFVQRCPLHSAGLGSILDTASKDTEDTAHLYLFNVSLTHFQAFLLMVSVSKYLKDTEDTAPRVSVSVS